MEKDDADYEKSKNCAEMDEYKHNCKKGESSNQEFKSGEVVPKKYNIKIVFLVIRLEYSNFLGI